MGAGLGHEWQNGCTNTGRHSRNGSKRGTCRTGLVDISLITCSPGTELYQLYGHTALRVREVRQGRRSDWVFNYGTFSFKQKNFMWRFMLGETDYELSVLPYGYFYQKIMCAKDEPSMSSV